MPKLMVVVGLPGSGKSYVVKNKFKFYKVFSSDYYRKLICGDENCQNRNQDVFNALYRDLRSALIEGNDCVFDATNVTRKDRARIFNQIKSIPNIEVIAYVMRTPFKLCVERDANRERTVGEEVIKKFLHKYEFPQKFEGFSQIILDDFPNNSNVKDYILEDKFFKILDLMKPWDQENPHHIYNLYDHCIKTASQLILKGRSAWYAGLLHDIGKIYTRHYDGQGIAHYYNHDCVGTYYILSNVLDFFVKEPDDFREHLLFLVNYHMKGHKDIREGNEVKYRQLFGDKWYDDLIAFADADINASGTEPIHNKLMQWIKSDKLTLNEIRNKPEYKDLILKNTNFVEI